MLGEAIKGRRDAVLISTKTTLPMGDGPDDYGSSRSRLIRPWKTRCRRLGTDYIDLLQLHAFDAGTPIEEVLSTLDDLVRAGKLRYVGVSNFSGWQLMKSLAVADRHGWPRYVAHQVYYSLVGRDYEWELMPLGLDQGVGALVWSPLGWGRLTGKIRRGQPLPAKQPAARDRGVRPAGRGRASLPGRRRAGRGGRGNRQDRAADRHQLAAAAPDRFLRHHRRPQRGAAAPEPRRRRLVADAGSDEAASTRRAR